VLIVLLKTKQNVNRMDISQLEISDEIDEVCVHLKLRLQVLHTGISISVRKFR